MRTVLFAATVILAYCDWFLLAASALVRQGEGIFWYGIIGLVLGVALKIQMKYLG